MEDRSIIRKKGCLRKRFLIPLIVIGLFLFWKYSYFIFVPNLITLKSIDKVHLDEATKKGLFIYTDTIKKDSTVTGYTYNNPGITLPELKINLIRGYIYNEYKLIFTSEKYNWKRMFDDYYSGATVEASNNNYVVINIARASDWDPSSLGGPTILLNFQVNRAKIKWDDIFILNRKTGAIFKHYRNNNGLYKAYYDYITKAFYFRTYESYYYLKI